MKQEQFTRIIGWQKRTFPDATAMHKLKHLEEEVKETQTAVCFHSSGMEHEFADCFMLLYGAAAEAGMTYNDICNAIDEKMSINLQRKWGKPDVNGVVNHINEEYDIDPASDNFSGNLSKLGNLYETGKDLVAEITPHDHYAFAAADKLRGVLEKMRGIAAVALKRLNVLETHVSSL